MDRLSHAAVDADRALREAVAWGCRILHAHGHGDLTLGHVSARRLGAGAMLMKGKGVGLDEVAPENVVAIGLDGRRLAGTHPVHAELTLHTEVYRARLDVGAVVHTHPPFATALGAAGERLLPVTHDAILFADGVAVFDETPALITAPAQGAAVATALGRRKAVIIKNHGILAVGPTVPWAVFTALTLERAARMQSLTRSFGVPRPIPEAVVREMYASKYNDALIDEYWRYLKRALAARGLAGGMEGQ